MSKAMQKITYQKQAFLCQHIDKAPMHSEPTEMEQVECLQILVLKKKNKPNYRVCGLKGNYIYTYTIKD